MVLPELAVDALRALRVRQAKERLQFGSEYVDRDFVFTSSFGSPLDPSNTYRMFKNVLEAAGLGRWEGEGRERRFLAGFRLSPAHLYNAPPASRGERQGCERAPGARICSAHLGHLFARPPRHAGGLGEQVADDVRLNAGGTMPERLRRALFVACAALPLIAVTDDELVAARVARVVGSADSTAPVAVVAVSGAQKRTPEEQELLDRIRRVMEMRERDYVLLLRVTIAFTLTVGMGLGALVLLFVSGRVRPVRDWHPGQLVVAWVGAGLTAAVAVVPIAWVESEINTTHSLSNVLLASLFALWGLLTVTMLVATWKWFGGKTEKGGST